MTRKPITPIKEQGQFRLFRPRNPNEKIEETLIIAAVALICSPLVLIAKLFGSNQ